MTRARGGVVGRLTLTFGICLIAGCGTKATTKASQAAKKPVLVKTVAVVQQDLQRTTTQPATVHAFYRAEIRAKTSGYLNSVRAEIGDFVKQGATLATVDVPEMSKRREVIEARIVRYESEEKRAESQVDLARANVRSAEAKLARSKSEVSASDASLAAMESEFKRTADLVARQSLESRMLDESRKKRDAALANKSAMEAAITSAEADVAVANAMTVSAMADVQAAQAETAIARRQLEELDILIAYATLKAPFDGVVTHRAVDPGDLVREGNEVGDGKPLFVVSQLDKVRIQIPIPEAEAPLVARGDEVRFTFPTFSAEQLDSTVVTRVSNELDPSTRTMLVEVEVENSEHKLLPGMFGQATISLSTKVAAHMLPARAIRFDEDGEAYVYVVGDDDQTITVTPLNIGFDNGRSIQVTSGVTTGQRVVDAHLKRFVTGQKVALIE